MVKGQVLVSTLLIILMTVSFLPLGASAQGPSLEITWPEDGKVTNIATIEIKGTSDGTSIRANGIPATLSNNNFSVQVDLAEGTNTILVEAADADGNTTHKAITVIRDTVPPLLVVTEPGSPLYTAQEVVTVSGKVERGSTLTINRNSKMVPIIDDTFTEQVSVDENTTSIEVMARDKAGNTKAIVIPVFYKDGLDLNVTQLWFGDEKLKLEDWPKDGVQTYWDWIEVEGNVEPGTDVKINGAPAEVKADGTFREDLYLEIGDNTISVEAKDQYGNNMTINMNIERLEWTPYVVHVEVAGLLLMVGLAIGTSGGYILGKWKQRKLHEEELAKKAAARKPHKQAKPAPKPGPKKGKK